MARLNSGVFIYIEYSEIVLSGIYILFIKCRIPNCMIHISNLFTEDIQCILLISASQYLSNFTLAMCVGMHSLYHT